MNEIILAFAVGFVTKGIAEEALGCTLHEDHRGCCLARSDIRWGLCLNFGELSVELFAEHHDVKQDVLDQLLKARAIYALRDM